MTTGKTIALTRQTFVGKVMSLLLNMLSRLVITFLPRRKHLLVSWLQSPSVVILEPQKIKSDTVSTVLPSISHEVMGPDAIGFLTPEKDIGDRKTVALFQELLLLVVSCAECTVGKRLTFLNLVFFPVN